MAREELFVRCYLLDPDDPDLWLQLDYPVDEKERISVRKDLLNCDRVVNNFKLGHKSKSQMPAKTSLADN